MVVLWSDFIWMAPPTIAYQAVARRNLVPVSNIHYNRHRGDIHYSRYHSARLQLYMSLPPMQVETDRHQASKDATLQRTLPLSRISTYEGLSPRTTVMHASMSPGLMILAPSRASY